MQEPKENKEQQPSANKKVKVKINRNRRITGVGKSGDVVEMTEATAKKYQQEGYVTILEESK